TLDTTSAVIWNNGTIATQSTANPPITNTTGVWPGTVLYNNPTGGQIVAYGTYTNLAMGNSSGTQTSAAWLTINGTFTIPSGSTLDMGVYQLAGSMTSINNNGTLITASGTNPPIPAGKTWQGTVIYNNATGNQNVSAGTY